MQNIKALLKRPARSSTSPSSQTMGKDIAQAGEPITLAVVGCGQRGKVCTSSWAAGSLIGSFLTLVFQAYSEYALQEPSQCKVVAIAEPRPNTRDNFAKAWSVDASLVFNTWEELLKVTNCP